MVLISTFQGFFGKDRWRVCVLHGKAMRPNMPASRWVAMPYHGWNETDYRIVGSRIYLPLAIR